MAAITFMEIMNCYPDNKMVYDHIKRDCGKLIPFVGAGLSVPGYPLWPKALKGLAEQVAVPETKSDILDMVEGERPQLLEAAQALEDYWGEGGMADHLLELFSAAKIPEHKEKLHHQSVWLLPLLFPGKPAVTTNFDRVLETVYHMQGCQFDTKILPNRQELQDQLRQGERHGLLKLHGDIGSETLEYSSIIFGKRQYEEAYQPGTPMVTNLQAWFSGKMLLFLGCSLKADEYLNLLQEVVQLHPGVTHYAILERTNKKDAAARARQLRDQWGIRALFYPKGRHEAVRVILEKLLEDRNPTAYQALSTHVGALPDQSPSSRFHYKSGSVSFHGRRKELEQLREFCGQEHVAFRWWAVTGAGGAGKSRLVYEFGREMEASGWNVLWLNSAHMDHLDTLPIPTKTLVVVDYAQAYLGPLGHWMEQLAQKPHLVPVRLLLLERDGANLDSSSWGSGLRAEVGRVTLVRQSCWREPFLQLEPLQEEELLCIMTDFAATVGKNLPEAKGQQLLDTLKTTDPELRRPLYAMFLTDAWANGEKPEKWGQKAVLDYVLQRENEYFEEKLGPKLYDLSEVFCQLRLVATIWDGITPEQVAQEYPHLWSEVQVQANAFNCAKLEKKMLRQAGLLQGTELAGLKPDLLGEYFVLQHLEEPEVLQLLFPDGWQAKGRIVAFVFHMYLDYHDKLEDMEAFWKNMLCPFTGTIRIYGMMWVNVAGLSNTHNVLAVDRLKRLWEVGGKLPVDALLYAQGLYNLSCDQEIEGREVTVERLKELQERYYGNEDIALAYAQGLVNLTAKQALEQVEVSVEGLRELQERYYGNEDIALAYAQGLANLTAKQELEEVKTTMGRLRELQERYSGNEEIAVTYAKGLVNLSCDQDVAEAEASVERLREVQERYYGNEEIALRYARGLFNLTNKQELEGREVTVERLKELQERYFGSEEIALEYAKGLFNLSCDQKVEEAQVTVERLRALQERYCGNEEIALQYAWGLFNLSCDQDVAEAEATIERLAELHEQYSGNQKIALEYAKGLVNLSDRQAVGEVLETIRHLEKLYRMYSDNEEMNVQYAMGLYNLAEKQAAQEVQITIPKIERLRLKYPENEDVKEILNALEKLQDR
ncbi:hypothetical protein B5F98_02350 [Pseudoflavonifractor sp. An44]|uniref:SIR2 family protein n=1 Tax=Pseudoflavonifractor sp. An44 TaxID=1965635 RepID=UPI000B37E7AF|nr:SIR2 family protein [Pseudoflavonifractor sp. An44]OUN99219.1 hypothetical protein B5F98_02350 [Pseudoflavonifractor sp. An44]